MSFEVKKEIENLTRKLLKERLDQCTEAQVAFFNRIFPDGVPEKDLVGAIDLCDRTIRKNKADPTRLNATNTASVAGVAGVSEEKIP